jgi:hypothetical protein
MPMTKLDFFPSQYFDITKLIVNTLLQKSGLFVLVFKELSELSTCQQKEKK